MRATTLMALLLLAACAEPAAPPPVAAAPLPAPIMVPTAIAPRLLPGAPAPAAANLTPAERAEMTLQAQMRADRERERLNAVNPQRPQQFGEPGALHSDMGDPQFPEQPTDRAPIFQRR